LQNISWLSEDDILENIGLLQDTYRDDPIHVRDRAPIEYIINLEGLAYFYDYDILKIATTKIHTIIKGHPLLDGNKRLGMLVGTYFLAINNVEIMASDESFFEIAVHLAAGEISKEDLHQWLQKSTNIT
jgi:death-on-curing protein